MLGFWVTAIGAMFTSSGPLNLPGPYWWFLTARGFQSLDDEDDGEPLVRRLWNKVTNTIDSLTPNTVGAS